MTKVTSLRKQVLVLAVGLLSRDTVTYACIQWHLRMPEGAGTGGCHAFQQDSSLPFYRAYAKSRKTNVSAVPQAYHRCGRTVPPVKQHC